MKKIKILTVAASLSAALVATAFAQTPPVEGSVEKIDQAAGKVTLKHGPIQNLNMDGMTMVFRVKDPEMLKGLKVGQKVKFEADRVDGQITVTKIQGSK